MLIKQWGSCCAFVFVGFWVLVRSSFFSCFWFVLVFLLVGFVFGVFLGGVCGVDSSSFFSFFLFWVLVFCLCFISY